MKITNALPQDYQLHRYRIIRTIGGGGFSIVYLAHDSENDKPVVIKEYLPDKRAKRVNGETVEGLSAETSSTFNTGMKRFFDEAAILAKVNHPNIVHVTDFFRDNNTVYMVMDYERGHDLRWYVKRNSGQLSEKIIRTVFPPLLHGLRELHNNQLLHLDIKPANILLRRGGVPLLIDFGASQPTLATQRRSGPHTLTRGFAPVEQHVRGHIGAWTDLYAIGATMWACISGKAPPDATKRTVKDTYKLAAHQYARRYSKQLLESIDWCLQMNQTQRPQSVDELLDYLNGAVDETADESSGSLIHRIGLKLPWGR